MVEWFRRQSAKIKTTDRKEIAEGVWLKCSECNEVLYRAMLEENFSICTNCSHHFRISSSDYIDLLVDDGKYQEIEEIYNILISNYKESFYIEIQRHDDENEKKFEKFNLQKSNELNIALIATQEVFYLDNNYYSPRNNLV